MAAPTALTPSLILQSAKLAEGYAAIDRATKNALYGGLINNWMPEKIYLIRKSIQYQFDKLGMGADATASITIISVPANGYNIQVFVNDPTLGSISLGSYIKGSGDTTTTILTTNITTQLASNTFGYVVTSTANVITIVARTGLGATINGNNLSVTANTTTEVQAKTLLGPTLVSTGTVFTTTVNDPNLGVITLSSYTQQVGDTTQAIFTANLIASIATNIYGYTISASTIPDFHLIAPVGLGATINGNIATVTWGTGSTFSAFAGGVTGVGIIPNTLIQFNGGVSATGITTSIVATTNYLWSLLGVYGKKALGALGHGGGEVIIIPTGSGGTVISIAGQVVQLIVGDPSKANPTGSPTPNAGDTVVTLNYRVFPDSENIFYQGGIVKKYPGDGDNYYIPIYGATTTTYTFLVPFTDMFALKFDFMRIVNQGSGGGGTGLGTGLQAVYVTATTTGNTLTVPELGTFISALIRGAEYYKPVITQTGQDLDLTLVGGTIAGETYVIFYYPPLL